MLDEAKLLIHSTFEALDVQHVVRVRYYGEK